MTTSETTGTPGIAMTAPVQSGPIAQQGAAGTSLAPAQQRTIRILRPLADAVTLVSVQQEARALIKQLLTDGKDYGKTPGVEKPSLLKPGAEKFNNAYGLVAKFTVVEKEIDHDRKIPWVKRKASWKTSKNGKRYKSDEYTETQGVSYGLYRYVFLCELVERGTGDVLGTCLGSCSTLENKYVDRPRDLENTVIKMAQKRAYVGATLLAHGLSDEFTQDVEDTGMSGDDTQPQQPQEPHGPEQERGTIEWAEAYLLHDELKRKLNVTAGAVGQLTIDQLRQIIGNCDRALVKKPDSQVLKDLKLACTTYLGALDDTATMSDMAGDQPAAGTTAPAVQVPAAGQVAPATPAPAPPGPAAPADPAPGMNGEKPAALNDEDDDLPF